MTEVLTGDGTAEVTTGLKPPKYSIPGSSEQTHRLERAPQSRPQRRWRDSTPLPSPAPRIQDPTHWGCISPKPVYRADYLQNPFIGPRNRHHQCTFPGTPRGQTQEYGLAPPQLREGCPLSHRQACTPDPSPRRLPHSDDCSTAVTTQKKKTSMLKWSRGKLT